MSEAVLKSLEFLMRSPDFVELRPSDGLKIDLRYGSSNNFVGVDMYGPFKRAFLHKITAEKLFSALKKLRSVRPDHGFIIFDALRPRSVQRLLWANVVGTAGENYIANPDRGSMHNYGFAVDLSVIDRDCRELDMGTGYDDFRPIAEPRLEENCLREGILSAQSVANRKILRAAMESAGFIQLPNEWWHFDALLKAEVRSRFQIVE